MAKAVELEPENSLLLSNAAFALLTNSLYESLDDRIDYTRLQFSPSIGSMNYHYTDEKEKSVLRQALTEHPDFIRGVSFLERVLILAPSDRAVYSDLASVYSHTKDEQAMAFLADKAARNAIDSIATQQATLDFIAGVGDDRSLQDLADIESIYRGLLEVRDLSNETRSIGHLILSGNLLGRVNFGEVDAVSEAVDLARRAIELSPSSAARSNLGEALLVKVSVDAAQEFPTYRSLRDASVRSLSDSTLLLLAMGQDENLAEWVRGQEEFKHALGLEIEAFYAFPLSTSVFAWATLNAGKASEADELAANIAVSSMPVSLQILSESSSPASGALAANRYWLSKLTSDETFEAPDFAALSVVGIDLPAELFP